MSGAFIQVRLAGVKRDVDFRFGDQVNYETIVKKSGVELKRGDVFALISLSKRFIVLLFGSDTVLPSAHGLQRTALMALRFRLMEHETWSDYSFADFCERNGVSITNLPKLADHLNRLEKEKIQNRINLAAESYEEQNQRRRKAA
jgi:hypothetical protein